MNLALNSKQRWRLLRPPDPQLEQQRGIELIDLVLRLLAKIATRFTEQSFGIR